jgi:TonB family protein
LKRSFSVVALFVLACALVHAQDPVQLDPKTAAQHVLDHPQADYPPIAAAAHVYGTVVVTVTIDPTGHISSAQAVSGPPMLQQAAADAVARYTYTPFQIEGKLATVSTQISVNFGAHSQPHVPQGLGKFLQAMKTCQEQINKPAKPADQVKACGQAAQLADMLPDDAPMFDRVAAYVQYATALIHDGKAADALSVGNKAIAMARKPPESQWRLAAAYEVTGEASGVAGNLPAANQYLTQAEDCNTGELQLPISPLLKQHLSLVMKGLFQFHAQVLTAMGNQKEAALKLSQAAKL